MKGNFCTVVMTIFLPPSMNWRRSPECSAWPTVALTCANCLMVSRICTPNSPLCSTEGSSRHDGQPGPAHEISDSPGALRARSSDVDLILELPYGPAANFRAASEAGHMAAPDHAQRLSRDSSCTGGGVHTCP